MSGTKMKTILTEEQQEYIVANRLRCSGSEIAKKLGINKCVVHRFLRKKGLQLTKEQAQYFKTKALQGKTTFTKQEDTFIRENYLKMPVKTLAKEIGRSDTGVNLALKRMGFVIPQKLIEKRKADSRIKPGNVPPNKGRKMPADVHERSKHTFFKKGQLPHNTLPVGAEVFRKDKTGRIYKMIKVTGKGKLVYKHIWTWEQHNGKVPKGYNVIFKDGDSLNCAIENLECISNTENLFRNNARIPNELIPTYLLLNKIKNSINEKQNDRPE